MSRVYLLKQQGALEKSDDLCRAILNSKLPEWKKFDAWVACYRSAWQSMMKSTQTYESSMGQSTSAMAAIWSCALSLNKSPAE